MKLFAINETEWIAAETQEEAIEFTGLEKDEIESIEEIPESSWSEEVECYNVNDIEEPPVMRTIYELMKIPIETGKPYYIMTEND